MGVNFGVKKERFLKNQSFANKKEFEHFSST